MTRRGWYVTDDSVGLYSGVKSLEVCSQEPNGYNWFFPVAYTKYTGTFTRQQYSRANRLAKLLNEIEATRGEKE